MIRLHPEAGEWTHLPFPAARFDRVISDGGMTFLGPASIDELRTEVARVGSIENLVERSGLAAGQFVPFLATVGSTLRYTMWPTDDIIAAWTRHGDFEHVSTTIPGHQLGSLCPVLAFRRRGPA